MCKLGSIFKVKIIIGEVLSLDSVRLHTKNNCLSESKESPSICFNIVDK